jgi:8-oxo-dGTP pyrophosphatase MutT (NUDIX family)
MKTLRIAAALMTDTQGRMLVVRKHGTGAFMQPGGKIDPGETPLAALVRELKEELGMDIDPALPVPLGRLSAPAAFESNTQVEADIFHVTTSQAPQRAAEIEELAWIDAQTSLPLAPLTRDRVLPLLMRLSRGGV